MLATRSLGRGETRAVQLVFGVIIATLLTALMALATATEARADAPNLTSGNGITVTGNRWFSPRTFEVDITTSLIGAKAVNGPHRIRVTLPANYFQAPDARYPVVYLLHGGAGGSSAQWTQFGGDAEGITDGKPVITVMADGGKVGWFTNWVKSTDWLGRSVPQRWADFYLTQVVPFIDRNLRTIATKQGRAIAGLSMGGYGAVRLAQDRPDLFAGVGSFSGAVDLGQLGTRIVIWEQSIQYGFPGTGAFGTAWDTYDPVKRASRFLNQNIMTLLYAGSGISDVDILERTMGDSGNNYSKALTKAGITHFWWMYGRPGPSVPYGCDGGHNFSCWNFAFNDALPRFLGYLSPATNQPPPPPPLPAGTNIVANSGFESGLASWGCQGRCGYDSTTLARTGTRNAWVRNNTGFNAVTQTLSVQANRDYRVSGWIRTSSNNTDGYFGVRNGAGAVVKEQKFGNLANYTQITFDVNSGSNTRLQVFGGIWANGDTYAQLDDITVTTL